MKKVVGVIVSSILLAVGAILLYEGCIGGLFSENKSSVKACVYEDENIKVYSSGNHRISGNIFIFEIEVENLTDQKINPYYNSCAVNSNCNVEFSGGYVTIDAGNTAVEEYVINLDSCVNIEKISTLEFDLSLAFNNVYSTDDIVTGRMQLSFE